MKASARERSDASSGTSRILAIAGKGGVGKTTIAAACALAAARVGRRAMVIDVEGKPDIALMFGSDKLENEPHVLHHASQGSVLGCTVAPDTALLEYLRDHNLGSLAKRLVSTGALDVIATSIPGIKDLLVLGRIKSFVNADLADVYIVDTPASGHAVTFLLGPEALASTVASGTIRRQSDEVRALLTDENTSVVLVTLAEETPINETIETAFALEDRVGMALEAVVVNGLVPSVPTVPGDAQLSATEREMLDGALGFERSRVLRQNEQIRALTTRLPLPQVCVTREISQSIGVVELGVIADALVHPLRLDR